MTDTFPRQQARTRQFALGVPRSFQVSPDGATVAFLRSGGGTDPVTCLWALDVASGEERLVADPAALARPGAGLDPVEQARRERVRERAGGIVAFATDAPASVAAFTLSGTVYLADLRPGAPAGARELPTRRPAADPRPDPAGRLIGYVHDGALRVIEVATGHDHAVAGLGGAAGITFGLAEFVAAEEMGRTRGYWWAPDGTALLVARVDENPVQRWHIADPANPATPAREVRYPAAGTANADVSVFIASLDGQLIPVGWDQDAFPYLVTACWESQGAQPLLLVQSRDQREMRILAVSPDTGTTEVIRADSDPRWLEIVAGVPARTGDGRIVWTKDSGGARRLLVASAADLAAGRDEPVTPPWLQVREVLAVDGDTVLLSASADDPTEIALWTWGPAGLARPAPAPAPQVQSGARAGGTTVAAIRSLDTDAVVVQVRRDGPEAARISSFGEQPLLPAPQPRVLSAGPRQIRTALLLPSWHEPGSAPLPVLMDPYGGPHAQRVLSARAAFLTSQWFAEQGFAVVIADGRGTPGRGPEWERAVAGDFAGPPLEDQVTALQAAAQECGDLDTSRVAIRGWSFGGYLSALAVLRRPDVFHAAVAGAPVTDWRLYDTHYTERYLGQPGDGSGAYERSSLLADAAKLSRPLLMIHGLADDNVVVAHTLRLSSALLAAGRAHAVLPLSGVTHMAAQEEVAENLLLLQVEFLRQALGVAAPHAW
ncbi:MAG: prolyl oligopeptidase family serine peptidase [Streptosporangiaceae bacterium]